MIWGSVDVDLSADPANDRLVEEWRPAPGIHGYEVSCAGRIRSTRSGKLIKFSTSGYLIFSYREPVTNARRMYRVHRIVAAAFLGPAHGMMVNHKDCDRFNNDISNLEYVSHRGNVDHAMRLGRFERGTEKSQAKVSEADVWVIWTHKWSGRHVPEIALAMGLRRSTVRSIYYGQCWRWLLSPGHFNTDSKAA
jgi:hypothetical protein